MKSSIYFCLLLLLCCSQSEQEPVSGERIISLSPSITATIVDMGAQQLLVGRSSFCEAGDMNIPVVGDLYEIDYERLLLLQPTKVLVQKTAVRIDSHLLQLAEQENFTLHTWEINRISDIKKLHDDLLDILSLDGEPLQISDCELSELGEELPTPILIMTAGSQREAGLCFGQQTYLDDVLVMIGGKNALEASGWLPLSLEDIVNLQPAAILIVSDSSFTIPNGIKTLDIPLIQFIHEDVLIPSSKIVSVAEEFKQKLISR